MGVNITFTDTELPVTSAFIEFIYSTIKNEPYRTGNWFQQQDESLSPDDKNVKDINAKAQTVAADPEGSKYLLHSYRIFRELILGKTNILRDFSKFRFFFVIGIPRTGGTYLTKQLFIARGLDYEGVQNAVAHDGFPHLSYSTFNEKGNAYTTGLLETAQYLTMVEVFFGRRKDPSSKGSMIVPKKFTKAVYNFDLIRELFGSNAEYILTLRDPLSVCKSVLDKSGGLPAGGRFAVRSNIERWVLDDWVHWGVPEKEVLRMDYAECIIGYWRRYHYQMAMAGIPKMPTASIVPYGQEEMAGFARQLFSRFGLNREPESFKKPEPHGFVGTTRDLGRKTVEDIASFWGDLGMNFPTETLLAAL